MKKKHWIILVVIVLALYFVYKKAKATTTGGNTSTGPGGTGPVDANGNPITPSTPWSSLGGLI